jgi:hypothetical protein
MRLKYFASVLVVISSLLITACETMMSSDRVVVSAADRWALLPIENLSSTPLAGNQARTLVETHLRARGVRNLDLFEVSAEQTLMALLDEAGQIAAAKEWAINNGFRYGITGNVQEWQYKNGLDNEPSVGMTLKFLDLQTDRVLWVASASRTGWGYQNLSSVASKTIGDLLSEVRFKETARNDSRLASIIPQAPQLPQLPQLPQRMPDLPTTGSQAAVQPLPSSTPAIGAALPAEAQPAEAQPKRKRSAEQQQRIEEYLRDIQSR